MYKLFLCLRYLRRRRIAFFAVGAVSLCVAMVLIVVSVMGGFLQMVKDRSRGMLGDLVVENGALQGFSFYEDFIDDLKRELPDHIDEATPVIITYGVLRFPTDQITKPVQVVGIRLEETYRVNDFREGLFYEQYYPGTTHLGEQQEPRYGLSQDGRFVLPAELEAARRQWEASATPQEKGEAWRVASRQFAVEAKPYRSELNQGRLPAGLRAEFSHRNQPLARDARVNVADRGRRWLIHSHEGLYTLERDGKGISVSYSQYDGPGFYMPIPMAKSDSLDPAWLDPKFPGAILGADLGAKRLRSGGYDRYYHRGSTVELVVVPMPEHGRISQATGMPRMPLRYVDDSRTGVYDIDSMSVYVDFDMLQQILNMDEALYEDESGDRVLHPRTTQVQIKLKPGVRPAEASVQVQQVWDRIRDRRIHEALAPELLLRVNVLTWEQKQEKFIAAVEKEKLLVTVLFGVISVVAVFLVGCIFYMIVQQKTRDIGIVKSVGATSLGVANIFLSYGAAVGVVGGALGSVLGALFVWYINDIQDLLRGLNPQWEVWNPEVYAFDRIPNQVGLGDVAVIYGVAIVASMVGSVIAAWRAARVWPVEALRYE